MKKQINFSDLLISPQLGTSLIKTPTQQASIPFNKKLVNQHKKKRNAIQQDKFDYKKFSEIIFKNFTFIEGYYDIFNSKILSTYACIIDTVGMKDPKIQKMLKQYESYKQCPQIDYNSLQLQKITIKINVEKKYSRQNLFKQIKFAISHNKSVDENSLYFFDLSLCGQEQLKSVIALIFIDIPTFFVEFFPNKKQSIQSYLKQDIIYDLRDFGEQEYGYLYKKKNIAASEKLRTKIYPLQNVIFQRIKFECKNPISSMIDKFIENKIEQFNSSIYHIMINKKHVQETQIRNKIWYYFQKNIMNRLIQANCYESPFNSIPFNSGMYILILKSDDLQKSQYIQSIIRSQIINRSIENLAFVLNIKVNEGINQNPIRFIMDLIIKQMKKLLNIFTNIYSHMKQINTQQSKNLKLFKKSEKLKNLMNLIQEERDQGVQQFESRIQKCYDQCYQYYPLKNVFIMGFLDRKYPQFVKKLKKNEQKRLRILLQKYVMNKQRQYLQKSSRFLYNIKKTYHISLNNTQRESIQNFTNLFQNKLTINLQNSLQKIKNQIILAINQIFFSIQELIKKLKSNKQKNKIRYLLENTVEQEFCQGIRDNLFQQSKKIIRIMYQQKNINVARYIHELVMDYYRTFEEDKKVKSKQRICFEKGIINNMILLSVKSFQQFSNNFSKFKEEIGKLCLFSDLTQTEIPFIELSNSKEQKIDWWWEIKYDWKMYMQLLQTRGGYFNIKIKQRFFTSRSMKQKMSKKFYEQKLTLFQRQFIKLKNNQQAIATQLKCTVKLILQNIKRSRDELFKLVIDETHIHKSDITKIIQYLITTMKDKMAELQKTQKQ